MISAELQANLTSAIYVALIISFLIKLCAITIECTSDVGYGFITFIGSDVGITAGQRYFFWAVLAIYLFIAAFLRDLTLVATVLAYMSFKAFYQTILIPHNQERWVRNRMKAELHKVFKTHC